MKWIVVTPPSFYVGEVSFIHLLFSCGVDLLHLRKPGATEEQCASILNELTDEERRRTVIHQHFRQAADYSLHGIHLNRRCPTPLSGFSGSISRSCHSLDEVRRYKHQHDYVFLSPVFNSISKQGYGAAFSAAELTHAAAVGITDSRVYALGGVTPEHIPALREWRFGGAAMLGCVSSLAALPAEEACCELRKIRSAVY